VSRHVLQVLAAVVVMALLKAFVVQSFYVPSGSMEPTVLPGDRVVVNRLVDGADVRRGDLVVFDGTSAWGGPDRSAYEAPGLIGRTLAALQGAVGIDSGEKDYLKRVIGVGGDHVRCCTSEGRLEVNGAPLDEPYLAPGTAASDVAFDVTVPQGRLWLLGDDRARSADARAHLGDPGGGMVDTADVIGRVALRYWPLSRWGTMDPASTDARPTTAH
jgi:signal peptidase I